MTLEEFFGQHKKVALAYSGGADSTFLLYMAKKYKADIKAYYVKTAFQPDFELEDAKEAAKKTGAELSILEMDILADRQVTENPCNRCYYCKQRIFKELISAANKDGYTCIIDGTNASDDADDRPGMKALEELGVYSPLRLCGQTKEKIRAGLKEAGIFTWKKPAYACLATRIAEGEKIREQDLKKVERGEEFLSKLGFFDFRLRLRGQAALLQVSREDMEKAFLLREEIEETLKEDFSSVLLDFKARERENFFRKEKKDAWDKKLKKEYLLCLSCTVDDMTGEEIAFVKERALKEGAVDFYSIPVNMKKGRPGFILEGWCHLQEEEKLAELFLKHTSSWGLRRQVIERYVMERRVRVKEVTGGFVRIKEGRTENICKEKAEYDDLAGIADRRGKSLREIREEIR